MTSNFPALGSDMYFIEDKQAYVSRIQKMLNIPQTGRIDRRTRGMIELIKKEYGISDDKLIGYSAFLAIKDYSRKKKMNASENLIYPFDASEKIKGINGMLGLLITHYKLTARLPRGSVYGYDAQRAVMRLRKIYRLKDVNVIDGELLYYINKDILSLNANYKSESGG